MGVKTSKYCSISSKPGVFGKTLYNAAFEEMGIDATYEPIGLEKLKLTEFMNFARKEYKGISVSMPFKRSVMKYCDEIVSPVANINTIKILDGRFIGHNTDLFGFSQVMRGALVDVKKAVIYGNGAVSETIQFALDDIEVNVVARGFGDLDDTEGDLLINASPVGMSHVEDVVFSEDIVERFSCVFDVVVSKSPTNLIKIAKDLDIDYYVGWEMSLGQLCEQFEIYTGNFAPRDFLLKVLMSEGFTK